MLSFVKKYISENTGILIRLDDIAENMNWPLMKKCEALFDKYDIKPLLGVVTNNKDPELLSNQNNEAFWDQIRKWKEKKWEIFARLRKIKGRKCREDGLLLKL